VLYLWEIWEFSYNTCYIRIQGSGIGLTAFLAMIVDLQPVHETKFSKLAEDLTIVIPGSLILDAVV
jgi:hypothetical protein